jgi:hypothetical protein
MKLSLERTILLSVIAFAFPSLMVSETPSFAQPKVAQSAQESLYSALASQEQALEQSCRRIAAVYREMAVASDSDSPSVRELKSQYASLAEGEEQAAVSAGKMAAYHTQLATLLHQSAVAPKTSRVEFTSSAYRR